MSLLWRESARGEPSGFPILTSRIGCSLKVQQEMVTGARVPSDTEPAVFLACESGSASSLFGPAPDFRNRKTSKFPGAAPTSPDETFWRPTLVIWRAGVRPDEGPGGRPCFTPRFPQGKGASKLAPGSLRARPPGNITQI